MSSPTLLHICQHLNEELKGSEQTIAFPFSIEQFCRENDKKLADVTKKYDELLQTISEEKLLEATDRLAKELERKQLEYEQLWKTTVELKEWQTRSNQSSIKS